MREAVVGAVIQVDAIEHVAGGVRVDQVDDNSQAELMGFVYEEFKVIRVSLTGRDPEKSCNMVSKTAIV